MTIPQGPLNASRPGPVWVNRRLRCYNCDGTGRASSTSGYSSRKCTKCDNGHIEVVYLKP